MSVGSVRLGGVELVVLVCVYLGLCGGCSSSATAIRAEGERPQAAVNARGQANAAAFFRRPAVSHKATFKPRIAS